MTTTLTILGGGNTAFAVAANLTLAGHRVTLCEIPSFRHTVEAILPSQEIGLDGVARCGRAGIDKVTTDFAEALADNELGIFLVFFPPLGCAGRSHFASQRRHLPVGRVQIHSSATAHGQEAGNRDSHTEFWHGKLHCKRTSVKKASPTAASGAQLGSGTQNSRERPTQRSRASGQKC